MDINQANSVLFEEYCSNTGSIKLIISKEELDFEEDDRRARENANINSLSSNRPTAL
jgi:hypothetical protein